MKEPTSIILRPHITERTVTLSYGDPKIKEEKDVQRKYTYIVSTKANKIEIQKAFEAIYNEGRKTDEQITVENVRTINIKGKKRRVGQRTAGFRASRKKAIITLSKGQRLEDYGV